MKKIIVKIKNIIPKGLLLLKTICGILLPNKKIYILGTPMHGNIGDQAIIFAERKFLNDYFKGYRIVEIESQTVKRVVKILKKKIKKEDIITIHGGGFIGSLWIEEESMFRCVVKNFSNNKIIVFPQTIYFSDDEYGKNILKDSKKIYGNAKNLTIACREKYSYDFVRKEFPKIKAILVPDIVLYLEKYNFSCDRNNALYCIRKDKEKINYNNEYSMIESIIKEKYKMAVDYTDTVISKKVYKFNREKVFFKKLNQISKYKIMITDRLHGMVFAYLTNTPCIIFENKSYKVKGVYEWIKNSEFLMLVTSDAKIEEIDSFINKSISSNMSNFVVKKDKFEPLIKSIEELSFYRSN